ncbi:hypothetical protein ACA910_021200 [Epithemia clementina (nom. ined.)]
MDAAAFCTAINRCGYNQASRYHIIAQGFTTTAEFQAFPLSEVNNMIKTITKLPPAGVSLPYLANLRLQGFRHWLEYRQVHGENLDAGVWAYAVITKWTQRVTDLANATTAVVTTPRRR